MSHTNIAYHGTRLSESPDLHPYRFTTEESKHIRVSFNTYVCEWSGWVFYTDEYEGEEEEIVNTELWQFVQMIPSSDMPMNR